MDYEVLVTYDDMRVHDSVFVNAEDKDQAEYDAKNSVIDLNPNAMNIEILEVREVG